MAAAATTLATLRPALGGDAFDLDDDRAWRDWRAIKLAGAPRSADAWPGF